MNILIVGGAGFIGARLGNMLLNSGHDIVILDNFIGSSRKHFNIEGNVITGNATSFSILNNVFSRFRPEMVIHFADNAIDKENNYSFELEADTKVIVATNILRCINTYKVKYVFFGSSCEVYKGNSKKKIKESSPISNVSYTGATNNYVESLFRLNSLKYKYKFTSFRYFGVFGNRYFVNPKHDVISFFVDSLLKGDPVVIVGPNISVDLIYVDEAASYTYRVLEEVIGGSVVESINIGSGEPVRLIDIYKKISNIIFGGLKKPYTIPPKIQNRSLIADTSYLNSFGIENKVINIDNILENVVDFRRTLNARS